MLLVWLDKLRIGCRDLIQKLLLKPDEALRRLISSLDSRLSGTVGCKYEESKVRFYGYTIHLCEPALAAKCGTSLILRRGSRDFSLMAWLVESEHITKLTVANLMSFMEASGIRMPKNTTKTQRIKRILAMDSIQRECSQAKIDEVLKMLEKQEERRRKKEEKATEPADEARNSETRLPNNCVQPPKFLSRARSSGTSWRKMLRQMLVGSCWAGRWTTRKMKMIRRSFHF